MEQTALHESRQAKIMRLIWHADKIAMRFRRSAQRCGIQISDLKQDARVSMIRAVDSYREGSPIPLSRFVEMKIMRDLNEMVRGVDRERAALEHAFALAEAA